VTLHAASWSSASSSVRHAEGPETSMDAAYVLLTFAFFLLTWGFVLLCERV
jgi:hypothetical protein